MWFGVVKMTESEFRYKHSEIIEYYQYIEMRLKFICSALLTDSEKDWLERLVDFDSDPFGKLLNKIKDIQIQKHLEALKEDDFTALNEIRERRNYWIHQCFSRNDHVIFQRNLLRDTIYGKMIINDLETAMKWDEKLVEVLKDIRRL